MTQPLPFTHKMPLRPKAERKMTDAPWPGAYLSRIVRDTGEIWVCANTHWVFLLRNSDWSIVKSQGCLNRDQSQAYAAGLIDGIDCVRLTV